MSKSVGEKFGRALDQHHPELVNFAGISGIAALDIFDINSLILFIFFCILCLLSIVLSTVRNRSSSEIFDENETLRKAISEGNRNFYDMWDDRARAIFKEFGLSIQDRISIYKYDETAKEFRLLGRYAENANFRERHRNTYPSNQGVIGKAWENGECFERKLPNPSNHIDKYIEENERKYALPADLSQNLNMKSTCLWAKSLTNHKDIPFAIVVVESIKRESLDKDALNAFFEKGKREDIENFLHALEFMEPNLRLAHDMGF
ncbi:hypothetical protein DYI23_03330 [Roseibium polysiphoniae]|uniref:Uncharacterized protein n=1 Tax=Roseibium polysiphoniae TaxID=2571221 RepID=A0A944C9A3_9HYPH|nr:hypothetical protein [Roseibium polysiphoniae]MBS8259243.1 hypothetical protein [Roseibium polysiphoniae]